MKENSHINLCFYLKKLKGKGTIQHCGLYRWTFCMKLTESIKKGLTPYNLSFLNPKLFFSTVHHYKERSFYEQNSFFITPNLYTCSDSLLWFPSRSHSKSFKRITNSWVYFSFKWSKIYYIRFWYTRRSQGLLFKHRCINSLIHSLSESLFS